MKHYKFLLIITFLILSSFTIIHKYYVSLTKIEYVKEHQAVQITTRLFIDDLENLLKQRYNDTIVLNKTNEKNKIIDSLIRNYLNAKINIEINNKPKDLIYIGKEYEDDIVYCYLEIPKVSMITQFKISNKVFFGIFEEQKNIIRTNINKKHKSFILTVENDKGMLKF